MSKISRSPMMVVLITLALTAVLGASCANEEAGSQADSQVIAGSHEQIIADVTPQEALTDSQVIAGSPEQIISNVTPQQAFVMLEEAIASVEDDARNRYNFHIIDIRSFGQIEMEGGMSMGPVPVDYTYYKTPSGFRNKLGYLDRNRTYLIYGQTGELSGVTLALFEELGFVEVYNMLGGFDAWRAEGLPIVADCGL